MEEKKMAKRKILRQNADDAYEKGIPIMNDAEYDATFGDDTTHDQLRGCGVKLPIWMGSLDKKRDEKSLKLWLNKTIANTFIVTAKLDGISALYDLDANKLYTRGNGLVGCDISRFIKYLNLTEARSYSAKYVRGELIMKNSTFEAKYSIEFKNARNLVAGQFNKKVINPNIVKDIHFIPYEIIQTATHQEPISSEKLPMVMITQSEVNVCQLTKILNDFSQYEYAMDGLVITENRQYIRNIEGNPKYAIAFKKETDVESAQATVIDVTWDISRWGLLKPVVNIQPIKLSGVTISKISGHNAKYILDNKLGPGAKIICVRSGDVIPYILSVIKPSKNVILPDGIWKGCDIVAEYNKDDDTIEIKTLSNIFAKLSVKYVSIKTIEKMYYDCSLKTFPKMLNCTKDQLHPVFKGKSADRITEGMKALKNREIPVSLIVGVSGVLGYGLGEKRVKNLFENIATLKNGDYESIPTLSDVLMIEGFAEKTAKSVIQYFPMMIVFIKVCIICGLQLKRDVVEEVEKIKICLSGFRDKELDQKYDVLPNVTKNCQLLVCKSFAKETTKMITAKKFGIKMVLLSDFK